MSLLDPVRAVLIKEELVAPAEPLWVAVSGGVDSMVLLHVLRALGHPCHVAHVDHGLRGAESDSDLTFVEAFCKTHSIPCVTHRVDVEERALRTGESTQMAARELRLSWLKELAAGGPQIVALAHHADDAVETFFMGLIQGMGALGWGSIPLRSGPFIRPFLGIRREQILAYAAEQDVPWREDASNAETAYLRNRIRHELLPMVEAWRPGTQRNLARNMGLAREVDALVRTSLADRLGHLQPNAEGRLRIPFTCILGPSPKLALHYVLRDRGFHPDQFEGMLRAMAERHIGATFHGISSAVLVDRGELVVYTTAKDAPSWILTSTDAMPADVPMEFALVHPSEVQLQAGQNVAWFDADHLTFPLELRPWQAGDRFRPVGLSGSKLVSDLLIDAKVPRDRKERAYVLVQEGRIRWLCGYRLAEEGLAGPSTQRVWRCQWSGF